MSKSREHRTGTAFLERTGGDSGLPSGGTLEEADGTVAEAARLLRMRRTTLVEKLRKYRLSA